MPCGLSSLNLSPTLSSIRKGKKILLLMLCLERVFFLNQLEVKVPILESIKKLYATNIGFAEPYLKCQEGKGWDKYHLHDGFLFRANKFCVLDSSIRLLLLQESHMGGLMGHFGREKTYCLLSDNFY